MGLQVPEYCHGTNMDKHTDTWTRAHLLERCSDRTEAARPATDWRPVGLPRLRAAGLHGEHTWLGEQPAGQPGWHNPKELIITTAHTPWGTCFLLCSSALIAEFQRKRSILSLQIEKSMRKEQNLGGARATVQTKTPKLSRSILTGTGQGNMESLSQGRSAGRAQTPGRQPQTLPCQVRGAGRAARCEIRGTSCEGVPSRADLRCDPYLLPLTLPACLNKIKSRGEYEI